MRSSNIKTDRELLKQLSVGDEEAYKFIFEQHYPMMYASALRLTKRPDLANDVCQEVFLNVWRKRDTFKSDMVIGAYLRTSAINRALNKIKSVRRHQGSIEPNDLSSLTDRKSPDLIVEAGDLELKINQTIDSLPNKCREVFILSRYENMTYQQIADQLEVSVRTVEHHISKALKLLKKAIADYK